MTLTPLRDSLGRVHAFAEITSDVAEHARTAEELRQSEERMALMIEAVRDYAIFTLDVEGRITSWNVGAERLEGYRADEVLGKHFSIFYSDEDRRADHPGEELRQATVDGRYEEEGLRLRKDGTQFWANVVITAVRDRDGVLIGFTKVMRDITERREAMETLRQSEEKLRHVVEQVEDYAIFMLDPSGRVASWNRGAERHKGWTADEIIGQHFSVFYTHEDRQRQHPQHELEVALARGSYSEEGWRVRKDGSRFWAYVVITALRDDSGRLIGFAKVTRDVSEKRATEELLRKSEERLRMLVESVRDYAIIMLDPDGVVTTWNAGAQGIMGYRAEEALGRHFSIFYPPEDVAAGRPDVEVRTAIAEGRYEEEGWRVRKGGERYWANVVLTAVRDPSGELRGFAKVTRDLTERRRIEREARAAEEQAVIERARTAEAEAALQDRDDFISVAAHELRTPLTALQLKLQSAQQMLDKLGGTVSAQVTLVNTRIEGALRQSHRLTELVERLLDVSRIVGGRLVVSVEECDLASLVGHVVDDLREQAHQRGSEVRYQPVGPVRWKCDPARLEQVAVNLLSNAIKYGSGKPIDVRVEATDEGGVRLSVTDRGIGIAPEDVDRIFARFERAAPVRHFGGLGLGLYVTRNIVEAHGGTIRVTSKPGEGSSFVVELPRPPSATITAASAKVRP